MKTVTLFCLFFLLAIGAQAQVSGGISINNDGVRGFYLAIGQNYHVAEREVVVVHERRIPDEEIPVVFFIARKAHVRPAEIVELRLSGQSWMDITLHYRLRPDIYYVSMKGDPGQEFGRAYGHWRQPKREWKKWRLDDDDIIKMVNLQFVSNHYRLKTNEVVRLRGRHSNFIDVAREVDSREYRDRGRRDRSDGGRYQNGRRDNTDNSGYDDNDQDRNGRNDGKDSDKHDERNNDRH
jgi:hypothetical protein